jgi:hypothetical protein
MKFIFENFLKSKDNYNECVKYWENLFIRLLPNIEFEKYFNTTFANGEDFFDGNPIFNFKLKNSNKAVLIIQEEPESENVYFKSWIDEFEAENETIEKLVIVLELSEKTEFLTKDFVQKWIINHHNSIEIEKEIKHLNNYIPCKLNNSMYSEIFIVEKNRINQLGISAFSKNKRFRRKKKIELKELLAV